MQSLSQQPWIRLDTQLSPVVLSVLVGAASLLLWIALVPPRALNSKNGVRAISSRPFAGLGARGWYDNRYTWLSKNMTQDPRHPHQGLAKFNLAGKVVYTYGTTNQDELRNIALHPDLSFSQGNTFLFAGIAGAKQKGLVEGEMDKEERREMKQLASAISPQRLNNMRPALVRDAFELYDSWVGGPAGSSGIVDLQKSYYPLIFRYTVRLMGMTEYASDAQALQKMQDAFWATQNNSDFFTTIMPWLPQPRLIRRLIGAFTLWRMVKVTLDQRIKSGAKEDDFAQLLIDEGKAPASISRFVIGGLMAGILNTIGTGAYSIAFLGADQALQKRARQELIEGLRSCAERRGDDYDDLTDQQRLERVSLEEWEADFKTIHLVFKETIRLLLTNSINRYYPGPQLDAKGNPRARLVIEGHPIEDDTYIAVAPSANLHDADLFADPLKFDISRYERGEGPNEYTYVAWGYGRHKCTGMRFAKLETTLSMAALLLAYEFQSTDDAGKPYTSDTLPLSDLSQNHWRTPTRPLRVRAQRRVAEQQ